MATYYLINTINVAGNKMLPGELIDDAAEDVAAIQAAGALLWPSSDPVIAAAALRAQNAHKNRGANEEELETIMQAAVDSVQGTSANVPQTRTITAGAGLTGGGDLSANRTLDVAANADGSIVVNANDVQVGILATDAQHGSRGGGTQHAAATTSVAGFMSSADKTKADSQQAGTGTLVAGTASIAANITASSRILVSMKDPGAGAITGFASFEIPVASRVVGAPGSFVVNAIDDAKALIATAVCTFDWFVQG